MGAQRQQRASVGVELFAVRPQVVEGFGLELADIATLRLGGMKKEARAE
jgi:hypothetical protein